METTINTINLVDTAMAHFDTINSTYLQPLSIFNTVVTSIANVCPLFQMIRTLSDDCIQIHPYAQMALTALTAASKVSIYPFREIFD